MGMYITYEDEKTSLNKIRINMIFQKHALAAGNIQKDEIENNKNRCKVTDDGLLS
jgi:hypothetical protein